MEATLGKRSVDFGGLDDVLHKRLRHVGPDSSGSAHRDPTLAPMQPSRPLQGCSVSTCMVGMPVQGAAVPDLSTGVAAPSKKRQVRTEEGSKDATDVKRARQQGILGSTDVSSWGSRLQNSEVENSIMSVSAALHEAHKTSSSAEAAPSSASAAVAAAEEWRSPVKPHRLSKLPERGTPKPPLRSGGTRMAAPGLEPDTPGTATHGCGSAHSSPPVPSTAADKEWSRMFSLLELDSKRSQQRSDPVWLAVGSNRGMMPRQAGPAPPLGRLGAAASAGPSVKQQQQAAPAAGAAHSVLRNSGPAAAAAQDSDRCVAGDSAPTAAATASQRAPLAAAAQPGPSAAAPRGFLCMEFQRCTQAITSKAMLAHGRPDASADDTEMQ